MEKITLSDCPFNNVQNLKQEWGNRGLSVCISSQLDWSLLESGTGGGGGGGWGWEGLDSGLPSTPPAAEVGWGSEDTNPPPFTPTPAQLWRRHGSTEAEFMNVQFSLRFLGIILGVLRIEVSVYNVYFKNQFQTTFPQGGGTPLV